MPDQLGKMYIKPSKLSFRVRKDPNHRAKGVKIHDVKPKYKRLRPQDIRRKIDEEI